MSSSNSSEPRFELFPALPVEIRLKIWRITCPSRVVEVQLHVPSANDDPATSEISLDLRPLARPCVPVIFHVCRESRDEALCVYRPAAGSTFASPHPFPYNLMQACQPRNMFSAVAAQALGIPREFILDRLAVERGDVSAIRYLAISWADMHLKDVLTLLEALKPFTALRELSVVFFEMRHDNQDFRLMSDEGSDESRACGAFREYSEGTLFRESP